MYMTVCLYVSLCTMCMPGAHRGQKRVPNQLKLELQMAVNCHVGLVNQTGISWKRSVCALNHRATSPALGLNV